MSVAPLGASISVDDMTDLQTFADSWSSAITLLGQAAGKSVYDLCTMGFDATIARQIVKLSDIYHGPASAPRQQEQARNHATAMRHTFHTLNTIEKIVRKADTAHSWRIRFELTQCAATIRVIEDAGAELLAELRNDDAEAGTDAGTGGPSMSVSARRIGDSTLADLSVRGPSHLIKAARDRAVAYAAENDIHEAEALLRLASSTGGSDGDGEAAGPEITPAVIIPIDASVAAWEKTSPNQFRLSLTNGTTMTGADYTQARLSQYGHALLVDAVTGQDLGLYKLTENPNARFANQLHRLIQRLKTPVCAAPGCGKPADECQMHHIKAYKHGGKSEPDNYTMLCDFDNGRNDDDPDKPRYGRIEKVAGLDYWVPAFGGQPRLNDHPVARGGAIRVARRILEREEARA